MPEKAEKKIGIRKRHVVSEKETSLDLARLAAEKVFKYIDRNSIDFLIICTETPDYYLPPNACILQDQLGLKKNIGAFDFNMGCSGFIYGLNLSKGLIETGEAKRILFIASETYTKLIHPRDRGNRTIFGDAAAATIIEPSHGEGIGRSVFGTDGSGAGHLIVPNGGLRKRYDPEAPEMEQDGGPFTDNHLYMNGPEIFKFMLSTVPKLV